MDPASQVLVKEIEALLDEVCPAEADFAQSFVVDNERYEGRASTERRFGIPGGGLVEFAGPILLHFVAVVAMDIVATARRKGADYVVSKLCDQLSTKLLRRLPTAPKGKNETIQAIVVALKAAGWEEARAAAAAALAWDHGVSAGQELSRALG